jgi:hypothetical protein
MMGRAMRAQPFRLAVLLFGALGACAHGPEPLERYQALSQPCKDTWDKYHQFFTDGQQDRYFAAASDEERLKLVADLHIDERLARYPQYVQDAIWSREVVPGMDTAAVLLSWGRPDAVDRLNADQSKGVDQQVWQYRRGPQGKDDYRVTIVQGAVTAVEKP